MSYLVSSSSFWYSSSHNNNSINDDEYPDDEQMKDDQDMNQYRVVINERSVITTNNSTSSNNHHHHQFDHTNNYCSVTDIHDSIIYTKVSSSSTWDEYGDYSTTPSYYCGYDEIQWDQLHCLFQRDEAYNNNNLASPNSMMTTSGSFSASSTSSLQPILPSYYYGEHHQQHHHQYVMEDWRKKICMWSFRVIDHWKYDRHTVVVALNILDRYLLVVQKPPPRTTTTTTTTTKGGVASSSSKMNIRQTEYQLIAMTCLYLAMKLASDHTNPHHYHLIQSGSSSNSNNSNNNNNNRRLILKLSSFVELSRGQFTYEDICIMEKKILSALKWQVHPVIPFEFGTMLLHNLWSNTNISTPVYQALEELLSYTCELTIIHLGSSCTYTWSPYVIASAAILLGMEFITEHSLSVQIRTEFRSLLQSISASIENNNNGSNTKTYNNMSSSTSNRKSNNTNSMRTILRLQAILEKSLWSELVYLLEEEAARQQEQFVQHQSNDHHHRHQQQQHYPVGFDNPIASGHALGIFDMDKVCRYNQELNNNINRIDGDGGSSSSNSSRRSNDGTGRNDDVTSSSSTSFSQSSSTANKTTYNNRRGVRNDTNNNNIHTFPTTVTTPRRCKAQGVPQKKKNSPVSVREVINAISPV